MQVQEQKLFTEISSEESSVVSGGVGIGDYGGGHGGHHKNDFHFNLDAYLFVLGAGVVFGNPTLTPDEIQYGWEKAISL
jgi:hypothetical protein